MCSFHIEMNMPSIIEVILESIIMHALLTYNTSQNQGLYFTIFKTIFKLNSCIALKCDRWGFTISILSYYSCTKVPFKGHVCSGLCWHCLGTCIHTLFQNWEGKRYGWNKFIEVLLQRIEKYFVLMCQSYRLSSMLI